MWCMRTIVVLFPFHLKFLEEAFREKKKEEERSLFRNFNYINLKKISPEIISNCHTEWTIWYNKFFVNYETQVQRNLSYFAYVNTLKTKIKSNSSDYFYFNFHVC